jgi:hypothetical protein
MSNAENIEAGAQHDQSNYESDHHSQLLHPSAKSTLGDKWVLIVSLLVLPLLSSVVFAVEGSPEVLRWIISMIKFLF